MPAVSFEQRFVVPRSFVWWGVVLCVTAGASVAVLCLASALTAAIMLGLIDESVFAAWLDGAIVWAFAAMSAGLLVGIVLNGFLPGLVYPRPKAGLPSYRALLRGSITSRFVLAFWASAVAAFVSMWFLSHPVGSLVNAALTLTSLVLLVVMCVRYHRFRNSVRRRPLYGDLSDEELGTLFRATRLDDHPEWEAVHRISAAERAEAYRQLARGRYLSLRLFAALITAAAGAAIAAAVGWVFIDPSPFSMAVAILPFFALLLAQFVQMLAEQYDTLADRYEERGRELATAAALSAIQLSWRQRMRDFVVRKHRKDRVPLTRAT